MAEEFSFSDLMSNVGTWASNNPGLVGAGIGGLATLLDPAQDARSTETQQVSLPDYIAPYAGRLLNRFEGLSQEDYIPYSGQRVADFNADQQAAFQRYRDMQGNTPQLQQGSGIVGAAADQLMQNANRQFDPLSPYQQQGAGMIGQAGQQLMDAGNQRFDQSQADFYMSPYQQSVIDIQKRELQRDYDKQMPVMDAAAVRAGAFGGDRQAILQSEAQRNLNQQLSDIQAQGSQSAFTNAQGQFNADMGRQQGALNSAVGAGSAIGNIGQQGVGNQMSMFGQQNQALGTAGGLGNTLAGIGQMGFQNQLATNQGLLGIGNQQQNLTQAGNDVGYQNFLDQRNHPYQQAQFMQQGMQGLPMTQTSTANVSQAPSLAQQLISSGIGGYQIGSGGRP